MTSDDHGAAIDPEHEIAPATPHAWLKSLAAQQDRTRRSLLVLASNNDPWNVGTPTHLERAVWLAEHWQEHGALGTHLRRLHYRLFTAGVTRWDGATDDNTSKTWSDLLDISKKARDLGLIDPRELAERRSSPWRLPSPEPDERSEPEVGLSQGSEGLELAEPFQLAIPALYVSGYTVHPGDEPYRVAVVAEKSSVSDVLEPLCSRLGVAYYGGLGYSSHTRVWELLDAEARPLRVLYVSDYDRAGDNMAVMFARRLEFALWTDHSEAEVAVAKIALTPEQIDRYALPSAPNTGATELEALEALEALAPGVLADVVTEAVGRWRDPTYGQQMAALRAATEAQARRVWSQHEPEVAATVEAVNVRLAELHRQHRAKIEAVLGGEQVRHLHALLDCAEEALGRVEAPERPMPEVDDNATDWLYHSGRDYLEQLDWYAREWGRHEPDALAESEGQQQAPRPAQD